MSMKPDITTVTDIKLVVDTFYEGVKQDALLGPIFTDLMQVNWENHLPKMYAFWEHLLFQTGNYQGRPFPPHLKVNSMVPLGDAHFSNWINLFEQTVDDLFEGPNATTLKQKAHSIQQIWNLKMNLLNMPVGSTF